jgi:hypothetical protein
MEDYYDFVSDELKDQLDFVPVIDDDTWYEMNNSKEGEK